MEVGQDDQGLLSKVLGRSCKGTLTFTVGRTAGWVLAGGWNKGGLRLSMDDRAHGEVDGGSWPRLLRGGTGVEC